MLLYLINTRSLLTNYPTMLVRVRYHQTGLLRGQSLLQIWEVTLSQICLQTMTTLPNWDQISPILYLRDHLPTKVQICHNHHPRAC